MRFIHTSEIPDLNTRVAILSTINNLVSYYPQRTLLEHNHEWFASPAVLLFYPNYPAEGEITNQVILLQAQFRLSETKCEKHNNHKTPAPSIKIQATFMKALRKRLFFLPESDIEFLGLDTREYRWPWLSVNNLSTIIIHLAKIVGQQFESKGLESFSHNNIGAWDQFLVN